VHTAEPTNEKRPLVHAVHVAAPLEAANVFEGHEVQVEAAARAYDPAKHEVHVAAEATAYLPATQPLHVDDDDASEKRPAAQRPHDVEAATAA